MRIGNLKHRIKIQTCTTAQNAFGEIDVDSTAAWTNDAEVWAAVWPLRGSQYFEAQQVQANVTHKILMRYRQLKNETEISPKCRVKYGDRLFNIQSVINPDERDRTLELMCEEEV